MCKKTKYQNAQNIRNAEKAASKYYKYYNLVEKFKNYILYKYDGVSSDEVNEITTQIATARNKITECKNIIDREAKHKSMREYSYGRKIDSGKLEEYDEFLGKFDNSYKHYGVIEVETYFPEPIEEVFSKKSDLLGNSKYTNKW